MAFGVRAYWQIENNHGVTDRIEIQEDGYGGSSIELQANSQGFRYRLSEITSESDDGLINPLANKIQVGKLTFYPKIESSAEETLLDDILGSPDNSFRIVWKQDGSVNWTGYVDNKKRSYPETGGFKFTEIRASDFELLKTIDYALDDTRQTLITTIADLLGELGFGYDIRTATSWITEDTTDSTDFLSQIYHETKALRQLPRSGDESPQPISVWDALIKVGDPCLLFRQINGEFTVEQLSEFDDPENVNETLYDSDGVVDTATATVDRRLTGFTSTDSGDLVVKNGSINDLYPAIKRALVRFDHRTQVSGIELPADIELTDSQTESFEQLFIGDGSQTIQISFDVYAETDIDQDSMDGRVGITIDSYFLQDDGSWDTSTNAYYEVSLTKGKPLVGGGNVWRGSLSLLTDAIPDAADGIMEVEFAGATGNTDFADETLYTALSFKINNPVADQNSTSILYQLTQADGYSTNFQLDDSWFGDGPTGYSLSALRFGSGDGQTTADTWQRRGSVAYRNFHENVLKEIMDLQRSNVRKLNAEFWGQYDPSKILVYDGNNYYCAGVSYTGVLGRWSANLFRINIQTGTDTFEDILSFSDGGSGSGSTSTGGSTGGLDQSTADDRYLRQSLNGSDIDSASDFRDNIGLGSTDDVTFGGLTVNGSALFDIGTDEFRIQDGSAMFVVDGATGQIGLGAEPLDDVGLLLDTPARAVTDNTDYDRFKVASTNQLTVSANTTSTIVATAQFDEPNINLAGSGGTLAAVTNAATVYIEGAPTEGDNNYALYAPSGASLVDSLQSGTADFSGAVTIDSSSGVASTANALLHITDDGTNDLQFGVNDASNYAWVRQANPGTSAGAELRFYEDKIQVQDNLYVFGGLFVKEFVVDQTRVMYNFSMSPEGGKIASVTGSTGSEVITFEDEEGTEFVPVSEGSILRIQERTGLASGAVVKAIWRVVSDVTGNNITLSDSGITYSSASDVGSIEVGDYAVQRGHTTDADLDGRIDFQVSGVDMPYISIWDGADDVNGGFEALRVGGMSGFDAGITGDVGIAGATEADGAVFWITEDEAHIGSFDFTDEYLTDDNTYIGNNLNTNVATKAGKILIGNFNDGSGNLVRAYGNVASSFVQMIGRTSASDNFFLLQVAGNEIMSASGNGAFIGGTLEMGASGEITNSGGDYTLDAGGLTFDMPSTIGLTTSLVWDNGTDTAYIGAYGTGSDIFFDYKSRSHRFENQNGDVLLAIFNTSSSPAGNYISMQNLDYIVIETANLPKNRTQAGQNDRIYLDDNGGTDDYYTIRIRKTL